MAQTAAIESEASQPVTGEAVTVEPITIESVAREQAVIEQAKGIIMGGRRCSGDAALALLTGVADGAGRPLHDIAQNLVNKVSAAR